MEDFCGSESSEETSSSTGLANEEIEKCDDDMIENLKFRVLIQDLNFK